MVSWAAPAVVLRFAVAGACQSPEARDESQAKYEVVAALSGARRRRVALDKMLSGMRSSKRPALELSGRAANDSGQGVSWKSRAGPSFEAPRGAYRAPRVRREQQSEAG